MHFIKKNIYIYIIEQRLLTTNGDLHIRNGIEKMENQHDIDLIIDEERAIQLEALDAYEALLDDPRFSDVIFSVEQNFIYANKTILMARGPVFYSSLESEIMEGGTVVVENMQYDVFRETLRFIYAAKVNDIDRLAKELLAVAHKYKMNSLTDLCTATLCSNIDAENVLEMLNLAELYKIQRLKESAIEFIVFNGPAVSKRPELDIIVHLHADTFLEIIRAVLSQGKVEEPVQQPSCYQCSNCFVYNYVQST